ncbi:MAG: YibE/F family protein [Anaerolineae bacterium]|nr:YibE/F family protein [Anaerolineae bacterium]
MDSKRIGWVVGAGLAIAAFVLLAAIAQRPAPGSMEDDLGLGETESLRAQVVEVLDEGTVGEGDFEQPYQRLLLRIEEGALEGQEVEVDYGLLGVTNESRLFRQGDRVVVERTGAMDGGSVFVVTSYVRTGSLVWLTLLFVAGTLLLSGWQGARSLLGMGISLAVIVGFIVPQILEGRDPILIAITGSVGMMGASLYLVYGVRQKTHVAVAGLFVSLVLTGLLAIWFVGAARLSGFGAEEAAFLQVAGVRLDTQGLLLAGIIIGTLGALDDIAIGQASAVFELNKANPDLGRRALFRHGMTIGRDHIASMVNTLLLAYVGAALPLVLLILVFTEPLSVTLNREMIAEEIVRTLVCSLGLLAGVPLTTAIAAVVTRQPAGHHEDKEVSRADL